MGLLLALLVIVSILYLSVKGISGIVDFIFGKSTTNENPNPNIKANIEGGKIILTSVVDDNEARAIDKQEEVDEALKVKIVEDKDLEKYGFFVDRQEDKLDTEPKSWEEYISQEETKATITETLQAIQKDKTLPYPHIIVSGNAGYGKSALIHLLAKESGFPLIETVAGNLETKEDVYEMLAKLPKQYPFGIIFVDEVHGLKKEIGEILLPITQTFKVNNRPIPYFCFAGATTDLGLLAKKLSPLVDRCKQKFVLKAYTNEELATIINNQAKKKDLEFTKEALLEIASRSRATPRLALGLLDNIYYYAKFKGINKIDRKTAIEKMNKLRVYEDGITDKDISLLKYLTKQPTPVGANTITQVLNIDMLTYAYYIEPFLVRKELIARTPRGRIITIDGKKYLKEMGVDYNEN